MGAHNAWYAAVRNTLRNASKPFMDLTSEEMFERYGGSFDSVVDFISDGNSDANIKAAREQMRYAFVKGIYTDKQTPTGWMMQDEIARNRKLELFARHAHAHASRSPVHANARM